MIAAFSTGSHAQYQPHPRTSYAQRPPSILPTDRKNQEVRAQRRVVRIHTSPSFPVAKDAIAKANLEVDVESEFRRAREREEIDRELISKNVR